MAISDDLLAADRQLYPTGRAFAMPEGGTMEGLHKALNISQEQAYRDSLTLLAGLLPDNDGFTEDDASNWERIYGLTENSILPLEQRMDALYQKIAFPGGQPARQHYLYIQNELQTAGFNVYIYENIFSDGMGGWTTRTPYEISGDSSILSYVRYGQVQYGQQRYGYRYNNIIANSIDEAEDFYFDLAGDLSATFFIGGPTLGSFADVPANRHDEFRQLILRLKPASTAGFLFINYV
jgi:hypothetical protein